MKPRDAGSTRFLRDVQQVLRAAEIGLRWADNVGPVATLRYYDPTNSLTFDVDSSAKSPPLSIVVLRAENLTDRTIESGCRITWRWGRERIVVEAIDVSAIDDEYDVTLGLWMG
jgi:hypothetical protein